MNLKMLVDKFDAKSMKIISIELMDCTNFWYFTAPRRFVILLMRVFVNRAKAVLLPPRSDMLLRYVFDVPLSLLSDVKLAAAPSPPLSPFDRRAASLKYEGKKELVLLLWLLLLLLLAAALVVGVVWSDFRGKDDELLVEFVLFE